jgi:hypothetical protein
MATVELPPPEIWQYIPAMEPPAGVVPNFANPESKGHIAIVVGSILTALMVCFFAIRAYTKLFILRKLTWDDCTAPSTHTTRVLLTNIHLSDLFNCLLRSAYLFWSVDLE